ncbi:MAG: DUF4345 family protein [Bacteroidota bacterium]
MTRFKVISRGKHLKAYLMISGITLACIGVGLTFLPLVFKGALGMDLSGKINILNDYGAFGMLVLSIGVFSMVSTRKQELIDATAIMVPIFFLVLVIGRLISGTLNGLPIRGLIMAGILELSFGIAGILICLPYLRRTTKEMS